MAFLMHKHPKFSRDNQKLSSFCVCWTWNSGVNYFCQIFLKTYYFSGDHCAAAAGVSPWADACGAPGQIRLAGSAPGQFRLGLSLGAGLRRGAWSVALWVTAGRWSAAATWELRAWPCPAMILCRGSSGGDSEAGLRADGWRGGAVVAAGSPLAAQGVVAAPFS